MAKTASITLSIQELSYLMRVLNIPALVGMGAHPLAGLSDEQQNMALAAGLNTLRSKGWVNTFPLASPPRAQEIDPAVIGMLAACATAKRVAMLTRISVNAPPTVCYVYLTEQLAVKHCSAELGLHEFEVDVSCDAAVEWARAHLNLARQNTVSGGFGVTQAIFDSVAELTRTGQTSQAAQLLAANGVPAASAARFADALTQLRANAEFAVVEMRAEQPVSDGFALVDSLESLWTLKTKDDIVTIQEASADMCARMISAFMCGP